MTRPHRTPEEMYPLVEAYLEGAQPKKSFAAERGVPESVLGYWITKYRREKNLEHGAFVQITPGGVSTDHAIMEVVYPHGVRVRMFSMPGAAELERLVTFGRRVA